MDTPVLLIHFNRPESTRRHLEALIPVAPRRVWILCDGPRAHKSGEAEKVAAVRALLDNLPWECQVRRLYRDENLGCFRNISGGISWFFDECEAGIIVEDDVIPDPSFFPFASELLDRYAGAPEVFAIAAQNRRAAPLPMATDYGFSNYFECWGWATWKRAWNRFDPDVVVSQDHAEWVSLRRRVLKNLRARWYWDMMAKRVEDGRRDSWAYRFLFSIWKHRGCVVIPRVSLAENVGFNAEGTHTADLAGLEVRACQQSFPLRHPSAIRVDPVIDRWFEDGVHSKSLPVRARWAWRKIKSRGHACLSRSGGGRRPVKGTAE